MTWKEVLISVLLILIGIISIYTLSFTHKNPLLKASIHTKVRNVIFYIGIILGVYGLYELTKMALKIF